MLPSQELDWIINESKRVIGVHVVDLFAEFQAESPVREGAFRSSWSLTKTGEMEYRISNNMEYATILFDGRRMVAGKWQGSDQWPEGGLPMLERFNLKLSKALDRINYGNV